LNGYERARPAKRGGWLNRVLAFFAVAGLFVLGAAEKLAQMSLGGGMPRLAVIWPDSLERRSAAAASPSSVEVDNLPTASIAAAGKGAVSLRPCGGNGE